MTDRWPGGASCAVVVTVDFDAELPLLASNPDVIHRAKTLSVGSYGATRGVDRFLREFAAAGIRTTWCIPGRQAELRSGQVAEIVQAGHEIAGHGHDHENFSTLELTEQRAVVERSGDALAEVTGRWPTGFRIPDGEGAPGLAEELVDLGYTWASSLPGDDLPYFHPGTPLIEIPIHSELHDHPYFFFNLDPPFPAGHSRIASYREVLSNWQTEFAAYRRYGLCYVLRLQPEVTGTPGRIGLIRELLGHIQNQEGIWIATAGEVAEWWATRNEGNDLDHPAEVFARLTAGAS